MGKHRPKAKGCHDYPCEIGTIFRLDPNQVHLLAQPYWALKL